MRGRPRSASARSGRRSRPRWRRRAAQRPRWRGSRRLLRYPGRPMVRSDRRQRPRRRSSRSNCHSPRFSQPPAAPPMRSGTMASTGPAGSVVVDAVVVVVSRTVVEVVVDAGIVVVVVVDVVDVSVGPGSEVSSVVQPVTATINDTAPINDTARASRDREIIGSAPSPIRRARRARVGGVRRSLRVRFAAPAAVGRTRSAGDGVHPRARRFPSGSAGGVRAG